METNSDPLRKIKTKHAPETTADIGTTIKAARVKKGASIEAVSQQTRIPKKFLEALENNKFDEFPALAYLRGFLKSYCDHLEIEFDPLWRQLLPETPAPQGAQPSAAAPAPAAAPKPAASASSAPPPAAQPAKPAPRASAAKPAAKPAAPAAHASPASAQGAQPAEPSSSSSIAGAMIVAGVIAVVIGVFAMRPRQAAQPAVDHSQATMPAALQPLKPAIEPQLTLMFRRDMWVSVNVDGAEKFQGRVPQGSKQEWKAKRQLSLRASDPQGLKLMLNGAPYTLPAPEADGTFKIEAN